MRLLRTDRLAPLFVRVHAVTVTRRSAPTARGGRPSIEDEGDGGSIRTPSGGCRSRLRSDSLRLLPSVPPQGRSSRVEGDKVKIRSHKLCDDDGAPIDFQRSPNQSGVISPEFLVMHYTAGTSAKGSVEWLSNSAARASAHLVIGRDGEVVSIGRDGSGRRRARPLRNYRRSEHTQRSRQRARATQC